MRSTRRRRLALGATAAGCALAVLSGLHVASAEPARQLPHGFSVAAAPSPQGESSSRTGAGDFPPVPSTVPAVPPPVSTPPVHVSAPDLHIDAGVAPTADTHTGIEVPGDVSTVGWWVAGAAPEDRTGTTVLVGHVDAYDQGPGALYHLDAARPGTAIAVTTADGAVTRWAVTGLQVVRKSAGLPASLFGQDGAPRLVLITCGGPFDQATRNYLDNVVVTAAPAG